MTSIIVIGIGSPFGVDALGWKIIEILQQDKSLQPYLPNKVILKTCNQPAAQLLEMMGNAKCAILIDALQGDLPQGECVRLNIDNIENIYSQRLSSHSLGLADTLALGEALGDLPQELIILAMETGKQTDSLPPQAVMERFAANVSAVIHDCLSKTCH